VVEEHLGDQIILEKKERVRKQVYRTRDLAKADIFEYVEMLYNRTRRHSHLGGLSPEAFEASSNHRL
jgi:putative transposase